MRPVELGWHRLSGMAVLILACVGMAAWLRSEVIEDSVSGILPNTYYYVESSHGTLSASVTVETAAVGSWSDFSFDWSSRTIHPRTLSLVLGGGQRIESQIEVQLFRHSYGWIVIPVTLVAAGLFLVSSRLAYRRNRQPQICDRRSHYNRRRL